MNPEVVEVYELATRTNTAPNTVYKAAREGKLPIPVIRIGRRIVFSRRAVEALLAGQPAQPAPTFEHDSI